MNLTTNSKLTLTITEHSNKELTDAGVLTRDLDTLLDLIGSFGPFTISHEHSYILGVDGTSRVHASILIESPTLGPVRNAYFSEAVVMMVLKAVAQKEKVPSVRQVT